MRGTQTEGVRGGRLGAPMAGEGCRRAQRVERGGAGGLCPPCSSRVTRRFAETGASGARRAARHAPAFTPAMRAAHGCRANGAARVPLLRRREALMQLSDFVRLFLAVEYWGEIYALFSYNFYHQRSRFHRAEGWRFYFCGETFALFVLFFLACGTLRRTCSAALAGGGAGLARISLRSNLAIFWVFMGSAQKMTA